MLCPIPSGLYSLELSFQGGECGGRLFDRGEGGGFFCAFYYCYLSVVALVVVGHLGGGTELVFGGGGGGSPLVADGSGMSRWGKCSLLSIIH